MRAIYYGEYGDASVYRFGDRPTPEPKDDELLVRVRATSVNPVDWKMRQGELKAMTALRFPVIPGRDVAGEVVRVGKAVTKFKAGDGVFGMTESMGGAYAEFAVLGESVAVAKPTRLSFEEAGAVPLVALTALQALRDSGELRAGESVAINGASGGVGTMAVQIAKALGAADVLGVAGGSHLDLVRSIGADRATDHDAEDFAKDRDRYDVIFDAAGKRTYAECKAALRHDGRYVTTLPDPTQALGYLTSLFTEKKARSLMAKDRGEDLRLVGEWIEAGRVRPVIDRTFPLEQAAEGSRYSEQGKAAGKIVLTVA